MATGRPDWFGTIVAAGKYDTTFIPIGLDETGAILALMKGAYDSALKTIVVDDAGVMKANLSVQDLDFLTVRPAYGQVRNTSGLKFCLSGIPKDLIEINGKGVIYGGIIWLTSTASRRNVTITVTVDSVMVQEWDFEYLHALRVYPGVLNPLVLCEYDEDNFEYAASFNIPITFETQVIVSILHGYGVTQNVYWDIAYALVP